MSRIVSSILFCFLMLSAPLGAGPSVIRLDVTSDQAGTPECQAIHQGLPAATVDPAWIGALGSIGVPHSEGAVELPELPAALQARLIKSSETAST